MKSEREAQEERDLIPSHSWNGRIQRSRYFTPESPLRAALKCITGQEPPDFVKGYDYRDMTEDESEKLQEWAVNAVVEAGHEWMTGIGTIEAAIHMVKCAEENGNIGANPRDRYRKEPSRGLAMAMAYAEKGVTMAEVGQQFGVSRERVREIINREYQRTGDQRNGSGREKAQRIVLYHATREAASRVSEVA